MRLTLRGGLVLPLLLTLGCPAEMPEGGARDLSVAARDLSSGTSDGAVVRDLQQADGPGGADLAPPDLARDLTTPPDLSMPDLAPPVLAPVPNCNNLTPNATTILTLFQAKCDNGGTCHMNGSTKGGLAMGSTAMSLRNALLDQSSAAFPMRRVDNTVADQAQRINRSFLLYKLLDQGRKVSVSGGGRMPQGGMLNEDANGEFCTVYNWVKNGAPL